MRQLAAILFADITGYTALMQENEQLARIKRKRLKEVLEKTISHYNGRILQYYGDGSLSIFNSAIDSVQCAIHIQTELREEPVVPLRIGIHTGDIIIEEETIYGDGVNLASRIESLAIAGGILISDKVADEIKNQSGIRTRELGYFELKNIKQPVKVFAIANEGINVPDRSMIKGKVAQTGNRLAVLPFVNMSADPDNEYFADGITEELLNVLTRVNGLQVTSRTSSFAFKGKNSDIREIATQLNVDRILEGSVRKSGNRVRITSQLINAADGYHIWSETYDRDLDDIFRIQDEIAQIITNKLRENFEVPPKEGKLVKPATRNITAYTYYLKGLHYWNKITPADMRKAIDCYEQAIQIEPDYAQAYAMTAAAYSYLGATGQMLPHQVFRIVHQYADKAIALDNSLGEGYAAKGSALLFYDWKWADAYEVLKKALELSPGNIEAYELMAFYYVIMNRKDEAISILEEAERMDPLSAIVSQSLGNMYIFGGKYDKAIEQAEKLLEIDPEMRIAIELKAWATGLKGNWSEALILFEEIHRLTRHPLKGLMGLAFACTQLGLNERALDCIAKMEQRQQSEPDSVIDADLAAVWFGLGDLDKCFHYLNRCIDKRMGPVSYFLEYPAYQDIKNDPRYNELLLRMSSISG